MRSKLSSVLFFGIMFSLLLNGSIAQASGTFGSILNILNTNCNTANCHNAATPTGNLVFDGSATDVYNQLVMRSPANPVASGKGDMLVMPGYPEKSYLLRKLNLSGWDDHPTLQLDAGEGDHMPYNAASLKHEEIELIRQWILFGCPDTGVVVDTAVLYDFYNGLGKTRTVQPAEPLPGQGFQLRYGPFFLGQGQEHEYFFKYELLNQDTMLVNRVDVDLHPTAHHFNVEKFFGQNADHIEVGFREAYVDTSDLEAGMLLATQFSQSVELPPLSAYIWERNTVLDLSGHAFNSSPDSVVAIEAYVNFYYYTSAQWPNKMYSILVNPSYLYDNSRFFVPPGETVTFTDSIIDSTANSIIDIWMLTTHTHKYGTSYNIYERDVCGGKGEMLYNGNFDQSYSFDQGYYDYEHPSVRIFEDQPGIPVKQGLIHEAVFHNYGSDTVFFGLTTQDEMMNIFMQYTVSSDSAGVLQCVEDTTGVIEFFDKEPLLAYPNPFSDQINIVTPFASSSTIEWQLIDLLGRVVAEGEAVTVPNNKVTIPTNISKGQYILVLHANGRQYQQLMVKE